MTIKAILAIHDDALRNGSFVRIWTTRNELTRRIELKESAFANGDFLDVKSVPQARGLRHSTERRIEELQAAGYREYSFAEFHRLAPKCVGGRGT